MLKSWSSFAVDGIRGQAYRLYLNNRTRIVEVCKGGNKGQSKESIIGIGILKGSVAGLFIFLIYMNDQNGIVDDELFVIIFVDDTRWLIEAKDL